MQRQVIGVCSIPFVSLLTRTERGKKSTQTGQPQRT